MKYIMLGIISLYSHVAYSQVYKFRSFETYYATSIERTQKADAWQWNKVDILVVINYNKHKVDTYGEEETHYDLVKLEDTFTTEEGDNVDKYIGIDQNGEKCTVNIIVFKDQTGTHCATVSIDYIPGTLYFRLKKE